MIGQFASAGANLAGNIITNKQNAELNKQNMQQTQYNNNVATQLGEQLGFGKDLQNIYKTYGFSFGQDYMNPLLAIKSYNMSKDALYNGAQIKAADYRKAGINPLVAASQGGSASVSGGANSVSSNTPQKGNIPMQAPSFALNSDLFDIARRGAETRVLNAQADKMEAETKNEPKKGQNIDADTLLKKTQHSKTLEEINTELEKQHMTKVQRDYVIEQTKQIQHDMSINIEKGLRTNDQIPVVSGQITDMLSKIKLDPDSSLYNFLYVAIMAYLLGK